MLSLLKKISSHSFLYGVSTLSYQLVGIILLPLYTRYISTVEFGIYSISLIVTTYFGVFSNLGIPQAFYRLYFDLKEEKEKYELITTSFIFVTLLSLALILIMFVFKGYLLSVFFVEDKYYPCFYITIFLSLFESPQLITFYYFRIEDQVKQYVIFNFLKSAVLLLFSWGFLIVFHYGILGIFLARLISSFPTYLYLMFIILRKHGISFSKQKVKEMNIYGFPFFVIGILGTVMASLDRPIMLKYMSMADVGIYSVAFRISSGVKMIIATAFGLGFSPLVMGIQNEANGRKVFSKIFTYYLLVAGLVVLGISIFSKEIIQMLASREYMEAYIAIPLLCLGTLFYGIYTNMEVGIFITKKSKYYLPIMFISSIIYVVLNFLLIPKFGFIGAALANALSFLIMPILTYCYGKKIYYIPYEFIRIIKIFIVIFMLYLISVFIKSNWLLMNFILKSLVIFSFPLILVLLKFFNQEELGWVKKKLINWMT
jgi:O-antigen/teichoic acid export membrane protein